MARVRRYIEFVSTLLDKKTKEKLIDVTNKKNISVSDYVRNCLEKNLKEEK